MNGKKLTPEQLDRRIEELEPMIAGGQFRAALRRLEEVFEETLAQDIQAARSITSRVHLLAGSRRKPARR